jgi:hypothetical protein
MVHPRKRRLNHFRCIFATCFRRHFFWHYKVPPFGGEFFQTQASRGRTRPLTHILFVRVVLSAKIAHTKPLNHIFVGMGTGGKCLVRAKADLGFSFLLVAVQIAA